MSYLTIFFLLFLFSILSSFIFLFISFSFFWAFFNLSLKSMVMFSKINIPFNFLTSTHDRQICLSNLSSLLSHSHPKCYLGFFPIPITVNYYGFISVVKRFRNKGPCSKGELISLAL